MRYWKVTGWIALVLLNALITIYFFGWIKDDTVKQISNTRSPVVKQEPDDQAAVVQSPVVVPEPTSPKYDIHLLFDPVKQTITGYSTIEVWNRSKAMTDEIYLQLHLNAFREGEQAPVLDQFYKKAYPDGIRFGGIEVETLKVDGRPVPYQQEGTVLTVSLEQSWQPQSQKLIELTWTANIPDIHHRTGNEAGRWWFGNLLPILAVYDGEWHTNGYSVIGDPFFSETADFSVEVETPLGYQVIATGDETEKSKSGKLVTKIEASKVRDFAFAITDNTKQMTYRSKTGIELHLYYKKAKEGSIRELLSLAADFLDDMSDQVTPYPYAELDIFENEMFITGMEYPGFVLMDADRLNDPKGAETLLHEIAHQWFYNLVGNDQVKEPWLDEGFATFYTDDYLQRKGLKPKLTQEVISKAKLNHSLRIGSTDIYSDWSTYWRSNYQKGSYALFDLKNHLGSAAFQKLIRDYVTTYQDEIATIDAFQNVTKPYLTEQSSSIFEEWFAE